MGPTLLWIFYEEAWKIRESEFKEFFCFFFPLRDTRARTKMQEKCVLLLTIRDLCGKRTAKGALTPTALDTSVTPQRQIGPQAGQMERELRGQYCLQAERREHG